MAPHSVSKISLLCREPLLLPKHDSFSPAEIDLRKFDQDVRNVLNDRFIQRLALFCQRNVDCSFILMANAPAHKRLTIFFQPLDQPRQGALAHLDLFTGILDLHLAASAFSQIVEQVSPLSTPLS